MTKTILGIILFVIVSLLLLNLLTGEEYYNLNLECFFH